MNTATVGEAGRNLGESQRGKTGSSAPNPSADNRESPTTAGLDGFQAGDTVPAAKSKHPPRPLPMSQPKGEAGSISLWSSCPRCS